MVQRLAGLLGAIPVTERGSLLGKRVAAFNACDCFSQFSNHLERYNA
jgi:hypothetical protein